MYDFKLDLMIILLQVLQYFLTG